MSCLVWTVDSLKHPHPNKTKLDVKIGLAAVGKENDSIRVEANRKKSKTVQINQRDQCSE